MRYLTYLCSLCICFMLFLVSAPALGAAADDEPVSPTYTVLTESQTLALYGTSIPALYYDGVGNQNLTFSYWDTSRHVYEDICMTNYNAAPVNGINLWYCENSYSSPATHLGYNAEFFTSENFNRYPYLIYRAEVNPDLYFDTAAIPEFQVRLQNSVGITGLSAVNTSVWWSSCVTQAPTVYPAYQITNNDFPMRPSTLDFYTSDRALPTTYSSLLSADGYNQWIVNDLFAFGSFMTPTHNVPYSEGGGTHDLFYTDYFWFSGIAVSYVGDDFPAASFTWNQTIVNAQNMNSARARSYYENLLPSQTYPPYIYLMIQCPVLSGDWVLPETTTVTTVTTAPPPVTDINVSVNVSVDVNANVDLSPVLTNQQTMINNQETMIDNQETMIADLDTIIDILNDMFDEMVDHGDINPDMRPVASIPVDQAVQSQINSAVDSAEFPDTSDLNTNGVQSIFGLMDRVRGVIPSELIFMYSFVLTGGLISFVIFRRK